MRDRAAIRNARATGDAIRAIARDQAASRNTVRRALAPGARLTYYRPTALTDEVEEAVRDVLADYPHMTVEDIAVVIDWRRSRRTLSDLVSRLRPEYADHDDLAARPLTSVRTDQLLQVGTMDLGSVSL